MDDNGYLPSAATPPLALLTDAALVSGIAPTVCSGEITASSGSLLTILLNSLGPNYGNEAFSLDPLLARTAEQWFDALSCNNYPNAAEFGAYGYFSIPHFPLANTDSEYTLSFKMNAPFSSGVSFMLNKTSQFRAYTHQGNLVVQHYILGGGSATFSVPYPTDEWVTVTSKARHRCAVQGQTPCLSGQFDSELYLNGTLVDVISTAATGFNPGNGSPLLLGRGETGGTDPSFGGRLDDVWLDESWVSTESIEDSWYICANTRPSPIVFENFEELPGGGCPTGSGDFQVVDRPGLFSSFFKILV